MSFVKHMRSDCEGRESCRCKAVADVSGGNTTARAYVWQFDRLRDLLRRQPGLSQGVLGAISDSVVTKLASKNSPRQKYRQMLQGVMVDGVVTQGEKEQLKTVRENLGLDLGVHVAELETAGWTESEFEQGYHNVKSSMEYEEMMKKVLQSGGVRDKDRVMLRAHRVANNMDAIQHLRVLRKLGWNLNEFEAGHKST
ncbi:unnamed protein product [Discosporangium mesarthrocarpum]